MIPAADSLSFMPPETALALVLRVVHWSETSAIVTLFTREAGKISAVAKGARRPKGPFESALDLMGLCRIVFLRKSSDALDLLTEAKLVRRFRPAARDLSCLYAGYYVAELLNEFTDDYDPHPALFDAADQTLCLLSEASPQRTPPSPALLPWFELTLLSELGYLPSLKMCADCGKEVAENARVCFGMLSGGVLCGACRPGKRQVVSLSAAARRALQALASADKPPAVDLPWNRQTRAELRGVLNHYMANLLGRKLRCHSYL